MRALYLDCSPDMRELYERVGRSIVPDLDIHMGDPGEAELAGMLAGYAGALSGHTHMPRAVLAACPDLREIVFLGTGVSTYVDMACAAERGIGAHAIPGYGSRTIAEHAIGLMFAATRKIAISDRRMHAGEWYRESGFELFGKTLGVVGIGSVGREVIGLGAAIGMRVIAYARRPIDPALACEQVDLDTLLETSDVVTVHIAHTPETEGLIDAGRLARMQPHAVLVNTARGALIDEVALVEALRTDRIGHAALDVFTDEPLPRDHPLRSLDNATLTAHSAWNSPEASERLMVWSLEKLRDVLS